MAKQKKRQRKKKVAPPLSAIDSFLYFLILMLFIMVAFAMLFGYLKVVECISFSDENVVAYSLRWTILSALPIFSIYVIAVIGYFCNAYSERRPILGNKKVSYKSTTNNESVEFLFRKSRRQLTENKIKLRNTYIKIVSALVLASFLLSLGGLFGRNTVSNSGVIKSYTIFNTVKNEWLIDDVSEVELKAGLTRSGYRSVVYYPTLWITVKTEENKEITFEYWDIKCESDENERVNSLSNLLRVYEDMGVAVTISGKEYVNDFIEHYSLTSENKEILLSMFEITER